MGLLILMNKILVIPSIDIQGGKTVRVVQGIPELNVKEYDNDPVEMAMLWRAENSKCLHIVDFDAIHSNKHPNDEIIKEICDSVVIPVELGCGIKDLDDAKRAFDLGIFRLVVGSLAFLNPSEFIKILEHFGKQKIAAAIDVVDEFVIVRGRSLSTGITPLDYAKKLESYGVERIIVTDVKRNGMLGGPNIKLSETIATKTKLKVTHSGGVTNYHDLSAVQSLVSKGVDSVIIGRALYENRFPCQKIWRVAESGIFN